MAKSSTIVSFGNYATAISSCCLSAVPVILKKGDKNANQLGICFRKDGYIPYCVFSHSMSIAYFLVLVAVSHK
jgi:hypothetical protein